MSEDANLQAKIAELTRRIDRQKQSGTPDRPVSSQHPTARWSPYGQAFSQYPARFGQRAPHKPGFRNRTLVNNAVTAAKDAAAAVNSNEAAVKPNAGITTRDRGHMQWTNAAVFDKKAQEKKQAIEETTKVKRQAKDDAQKSQVLEHVYGAQQPGAPAQTAAAPREIIVNDLRFRVATDGSKLIRVFGERVKQPSSMIRVLSSVDGPQGDPHSTPKEAKVAGITFVRTKNGNMVRQGLLKNKRVDAGKIQRKLCQDFTSTGTETFPTGAYRSSTDGWLAAARASVRSCGRGNRCRFSHDINKLAICKDFLRRGECADGEDCNLSHDLTPNRVPTCTHFIRDNCTKPDCRYAHVQVDPSAPVCNNFARLGYCDKGAECAERHVSECPDYTNAGVCRNRKCRLPHIDRAGTLRKAAALKAGRGADDDGLSIDVSSDEEEFQEIDSDDADSEEIEEDVVMVGSGDNGHELSQQQDFISFS